jgi:hypothetical protein
MSSYRSSGKAIAAVGMSLGLGYGSMLAVHEVSLLNEQASLVNACFGHNISALDKMCYDQPVTTTEADQLSDDANTYGRLGWLAFGGSVIAFGASIEVITDLDVVSTKRKKSSNTSSSVEAQTTVAAETSPHEPGVNPSP